MLNSDTPIEPVINIFANLSLSTTYLVLTETGYRKSIMDCTFSVRKMFKDKNFHNYDNQLQGPTNKVKLPTYIVFSGLTIETACSLYRPITKKGDPRIWIYNLKQYCKPNNLLALCVANEALYVFIMSDENTRNALQNLNDPIQETILNIKKGYRTVFDELIFKMKDIHNAGFIPSIIQGSTGVGMTLENALGISPNNRALPDYKGIELKCSRVDDNSKQKNRLTMFSKAPNWKLNNTSAANFLEKWGYLGLDKNGSERFNLHCTLSSKNLNSQGLSLSIDDLNGLLWTLGKKTNEIKPQKIFFWEIQTLLNCLQLKHKETFWVKATSKIINNLEYFSYDLVIYTANPRLENFQYLLESGIITLDFLMNFKDEYHTKVRDHGYLFKIQPEKSKLLFPQKEIIKL